MGRGLELGWVHLGDLGWARPGTCVHLGVLPLCTGVTVCAGVSERVFMWVGVCAGVRTRGL